jgi:hypothetical protein
MLDRGEDVDEGAAGRFADRRKGRLLLSCDFFPFVFAARTDII